MSKVQNNSYINIQGWMVNELNLSGTSLMVYAIIYGFSQDDGSVFSGSRQYLADWCNCSVRNIQMVLNDLVDRDLLTKYEYTKNNIKYCEYAANFPSGEKSSLPPGEKISPPGEKISPNILEDKLEDNNIEKIKKPKKLSLYEKCYSYILEYTNDESLIKALDDYLRFRLSVSDKKIYHGQWKAMLTKLDSLKGDAIKIVSQSLEKGWLSFYDLQTTTYNSGKPNKSNFGETNSIHSEKIREESSGTQF